MHIGSKLMMKKLFDGDIKIRNEGKRQYKDKKEEKEYSNDTWIIICSHNIILSHHALVCLFYACSESNEMINDSVISKSAEFLRLSSSAHHLDIMNCMKNESDKILDISKYFLAVMISF